MQELTNKRITGVYIGAHESSIKFTLEGSADPIVFDCGGDCCSETWFSEILNVDALVGHVVMSVETLNLPHHEDGNGRQEYDRFYGYGIATDAGHCTIVFRNSSNGYYGGDCGIGKDDGKREWISISHLTDWTAYDVNAEVVNPNTMMKTHNYYRLLKCSVLF